MSKILHIDSSSRSATSVTRKLSKYLTEALQKSEPGHEVKYRDLIAENPHFISEAVIGAIYTPVDARTVEQKQTLAQAEKGLNDFIEADVYVFGVPMYNFSVPAVFKAFIDLSVVAGKTFSYEGGIPKPLLKNKKAFVLTSSGGNYDEPPYNKMDFLQPYLRAIFGFIGITDMTFVRVQGHSEAEIAAATDAAIKQIDELAAAFKQAQPAQVGAR